MAKPQVYIVHWKPFLTRDDMTLFKVFGTEALAQNFQQALIANACVWFGCQSDGLASLSWIETVALEGV